MSLRSIFMKIPITGMLGRGWLALALLSTPAFLTRASSQSISTNIESRQITSRSELKLVAEGSQSSITQPFVAVIRDSETYEALRREAGNLPDTSVDFQSHIVIAAFLGERNTGGYSVEIAIEVAFGTYARTDQRPAQPFIRIKEKVPEKGTMVPQMVTYPFKVVSLEVNPVASVVIAPDSPWQQPMQHYVVTGGRFTVTGGIAGRTDQLKPQGNLWIMRQRNLASVMFVVFSADNGATHVLSDYATGVVDADASIKINRMSPDTFVDPPSSGLKALVKSVAGGKLSIMLNSLPSMISDGYSGMGTIEATSFDSMVKP